MKKLILIFLVSIPLLAGDFRDIDWGMSIDEALSRETLDKVEYNEQKVSRTFTTFKGDMVYSYTIDEYSFYDTIASLGQFKVTLIFLENKLIRTRYEQEISNGSNHYERLQKYLIWKYGSDFEAFGFEDNYIWKTDRTKVVLDLIPNRSYTIDYYANTEDMLDFVYNIENGKEFQKLIGTEYEEYINIKDKI